MALDLMNAIEKMDFDNPGRDRSDRGDLARRGCRAWQARLELQAPGSGGMFVCTVGGSVAYNSVPHGLARYGMTGDGVVALEVVLPNGEVMWTGRRRPGR